MTDADNVMKLAQAAKYEAEASKLLEEARKRRAEANAAEDAAEQVAISTARERWKRERELLSDEERNVYRFSGEVSSQSVASAINSLVMWKRHRGDHASDLRFIINSPGGEITSGVSLFDFLRSLSASGVHITTVATGMAASMGAILTQAGDDRVIMPSTSFMLHEAAFGAVGKTYEIEDRTEWVKQIQDRFKKILAERSNLTEKQVENKWSRKDWWMTADTACDEFGFFDRIGDAHELL